MIRRPMNCLSIAALAWIFLGAPDLVPAQQPGAAIAEPAIYAPGVPPVYLSAKHAKLCTTRVGDRLPSVELPRLDGSPATPQSLSGEQATVVLFWSSDGWMSHAALRDLGRDIAAEFDPKLVSLVGVAVESPEAAVRESIRVAGARFPQFLDADGALMRQIGAGHLPRIYVLDASAKGGDPIVAWFDIEYSEATRRELRATLLALTKKSRN